MIRFLLLISLSFSATLQAQDWIRLNPERQDKISERELLRRYPEGKSWVATKVLRLQGISEAKQWGLEGRQHVVYSNRYQSYVKVLSNDLGELTLEVLVADASEQRIVSKKKLKVDSFRKASPLFTILITKAGRMAITNPYAIAVGAVVIAWGKLDPKYEKTLTTLLNLSGIDIDDFADIPEAQIIEDPEAIAGCRFELVWVNGLGVTEFRQIDGPVKVKLEEVQRWVSCADPMFDYYIMDSMDKKIGDSWEVAGEHAVDILSSHGASEGSGGLKLKYLRDGQYDGKPCRQLAIQSGKLRLFLNRNNRDTQATISQIQGKVMFGKQDFLVLEADGTLAARVDIEKDHILFGAEWTRDVDLQFRYEAQLKDNGK